MSQKITYVKNSAYPFPHGPHGITRDISGVCMISAVAAGDTDETGEPAPLCPSDQHDYCCKSFINVYSITEQTIDNGSPIQFDTHSACCGDCYHDENSTDIWIWKAGYYQVSVNIYSIESVQFSLVMNDSIVIPGTTFGSLTGLSSNNMTAIICIEDSDMDLPLECSPSGYGCKLQVVNNTCYLQYITLYGSSCSSNIIEQNTASMTIIKI